MAIKANLNIDQGATFNTQLVVTDADGDAVDLTGYTGAGQIRKHYTSSNSVSFSVSVSNTYSTVSLSLTANVTSLLSAGRYVYDVELTSSTGIVTRVLEGIVSVSPNVTR